MKGYVNGSPAGAKTDMPNISDSPAAFTIGARDSGAGDRWIGEVALFRVYDRALSDAEVLTVHNALKAGLSGRGVALP